MKPPYPNRLKLLRQRSVFIGHLLAKSFLPVLTLCMAGCQPENNTQSGNPMTAPVDAPELTMPRKEEAPVFRMATFNAAMGFEAQGEMAEALQNPDHEQLKKLARVLQTIRPDIVLLNEFDYDPDIDAANLLQANFLSRPGEGLEAIDYPFHYRAESNTGIPSGLDIDGDGKTDSPGDGWGFGFFPGQFGMLLLSRHPIDEGAIRSFQKFKWSQLAGARRPRNPDGSEFYSDDTWQQLRLSSKSHWDVPVEVNGRILHVLAFHPTPPVFDGPENRNGLRNFDEIRFWADYLRPAKSESWVDDQGQAGGLDPEQQFVILGDYNSDPFDGDSEAGAVQQLLEHERIDSSFTPTSSGAIEASHVQGGINDTQGGDPAADTADFNDQKTGNLRLDYLLPSHALKVVDGGVFWPAAGEPGHDWISVSDHRLVWVDLQYEGESP